MNSQQNFHKSYPLSKTIQSKTLGRIDPMIDSLAVKHQSGIYCKNMCNETLLFIQDPDKYPPRFMKSEVGNKEKLKAN